MGRATLSTFPFVTVRLHCTRCPRAGAYRLARLAAEHGPETPLVALLAKLAANCPDWNPPNAWQPRCGARFTDLGGPQRPPDEPPEAPGVVQAPGRPPGPRPRPSLVA